MFFLKKKKLNISVIILIKKVYNICYDSISMDLRFSMESVVMGMGKIPVTEIGDGNRKNIGSGAESR